MYLLLKYSGARFFLAYRHLSTCIYGVQENRHYTVTFTKIKMDLSANSGSYLELNCEKNLLQESLYKMVPTVSEYKCTLCAIRINIWMYKKMLIVTLFSLSVPI